MPGLASGASLLLGLSCPKFGDSRRSTVGCRLSSTLCILLSDQQNENRVRATTYAIFKDYRFFLEKVLKIPVNLPYSATFSGRFAGFYLYFYRFVYRWRFPSVLLCAYCLIYAKRSICSIMGVPAKPPPL